MCLFMAYACSVVSNYLWPHLELQLARLLCQGIFPDKNNGVGCHFFAGDLQNPGIKLCLLWVLYRQADFNTWSTGSHDLCRTLFHHSNNRWSNMATAVMSSTLILQNFNRMIKVFWYGRKNEGSSPISTGRVLTSVAEDGWSHHWHFLKH